MALGRLLLAPCDALLLDEPYTGLDASLRRALTELVVTLVSRRNIPALLVAHELVDAQAFAYRLAVLDCGAILQVGPLPGEVVRRPASEHVAQLVGYLGFVPVRGLPQARAWETSTTAPPSGDGGVRAGGGDATGATAGVHPERVIVGSH